MTKVLLVEDEPALIKGLKYSLEAEGFTVYVAETGPQGLSVLAEAQPDIVVLDLMLPEMDGMEVCRRIRAQSTVPIIILTARHDDADKIRGLGVGADDYMTKPFNTDELIARIRSHLRRFAWGGASEQRVLNFGDLSIDILKRTVRISGKNIDLTTKEFAILQLLAANPGRAFTREELLRQIWGYEHYGGVRNVDVHIKRLRAKIEKDPISPEYLMTAWGIGYKFREAL